MRSSVDFDADENFPYPYPGRSATRVARRRRPQAAHAQPSRDVLTAAQASQELDVRYLEAGDGDDRWLPATGEATTDESDDFWSSGTKAAAGGEAAAADARLLTTLRPLLAAALPALYPRALFLVFGFGAITALAFAYAEVLSLRTAATLILLPSIVGTIVLGLRHREWGWRALVGYSAGLMAVALYDVLRLGLVEVGLWGDPIPHIGTLLIGDQTPHFWWGYLWRFYGNAAGMGMAYAMLPWRGVVSGVIFGTAVCLGLFALLIVAPTAQGHFFPLTPLTALGALAGHWVYGAVLGWATATRIPKPVRER